MNRPGHAPYCAAPDPNPRAPQMQVPAGACDTHVHVFGPAARYPYQENRGYTPPDSPPDALARLHAALGIDRAVLVQASVHGTDNSAILDAVALDPAHRCCVAAVSEDVSDAELERLAAGGAKGIRVNLVDKGGMPFSSLASLQAMGDRIAGLGWHIEFLVHAEKDAGFIELAAKLPVPSVVGHLGYAKSPARVEEPGYRRFLSLVEDGRCWVKLTGPYRVSAEDDPPYADVAPFAEALIATRPDRIVWGSDWPHVMQIKPMPNDGDLIDLVAAWAGDEATTRRILVENPAELYGFGASEQGDET